MAALRLCCCKLSEIEREASERQRELRLARGRENTNLIKEK